jgi:hypothetical protein
MPINLSDQLRTWLRPCAFNPGSLLRIGVILTGALLAASPSIRAQPDDTRAWGYVFGGAGSCIHGVGFFHAGGGGEALLNGGFGVTAELGYLAFFEAPELGVGLFSPGVLYAFNRGQKTVPFVTGGYTLYFREGSAHGFYVGGGVNRWIGDHWGIRIEGREQVMPACDDHFLEARFAIIFR